MNKLDFSLFPYLVDRTTNKVFYVDENGTWYEWHGHIGPGLNALDGFWSVLGQIGAAATFAIPGVGAALGPIATAAMGAFAQNSAQKEQAKQLAHQWDQLAGQTTALFDQIQRQPSISASDVQRAAEAFSQLETIAQQANVPWITEQWATSAYRPAYVQRLMAMEDRVPRPAGSTAATGAAGPTGSSNGSSSPAAQLAATTGLPVNEWWFWPALIGLGALLFLR